MNCGPNLATAPCACLMGVGCLFGLTTWHRWEELFDLAHIVIAHRPGFSAAALQSSLPGPRARSYLQRLAAPTGNSDARQRRGRIFTPGKSPRWIFAATQIRELLAGGGSARYLVPDAVLDYIETNRLYKERDAR